MTLILADCVSKGTSQALQVVEHLSDVVQAQSAGQIRIASATAILFISYVSYFYSSFFKLLEHSFI